MKVRPKNGRSPIRKNAQTRILIIDGDSLLVEILKECLESEKGFTVFSADNGIAGVRAAVEFRPDLILLDFYLKDMSGLEVHDRLLHDPVTENIPIVYISSFLTLRTIERASDMGAKGFIRKPFTPTDIYIKVARVLGR
jgi:two-component system alkaline phosphatase synthesis response regulator PhoP